MPRPKRTKVASATLRVVPRSAIDRVTSDAVTELSDDSQGFVTTKKTRRGRKAHQSDDVDLTMTGAIQLDAVTSAPMTNKRSRVLPRKKEIGEEQAKTIEALKRRRDAAKAADGVHDQPARTVAKDIIEDHAENARPHETRREETPEASAQALASAQKATTEESELSLASPSLGEHSFDSNSPQSIRRPQSALKMRGTPGAEQSILALGNFKRRPRQPSILRMVQQPSDLGLDDLDIDLEDFNPEDESTPINTRTTSGQHVFARSDPDVIGTSSSRKRKRSSPLAATPVERSSEIQVVRSSPPPISSPTKLRETASPVVSNPIASSPPASSSLSQHSALPEVIEQTPQTEEPNDENPDIFSETMAPPMSSSPPPIIPAPKPVEEEEPTHTKRRRGPNRNPPATKNTTTTYLQTLLPRRRTRATYRQDDFEIPSSDSVEAEDADPDQDELHRPNNRKAPTPRPAKTPVRTKPQKNGTKKRGRPVGNKGNTQPTALSPLKSTKPAAKTKKTYGRRGSSDKENENEDESSFAIQADETDDLPLGDQSTSTITPADGKRLNAMAKKFAEVDEWEMEFESVDVGGESSSPWR